MCWSSVFGIRHPPRAFWVAKLKVPDSGTINGRDFVPARKHSQAYFSTNSTARKWNRARAVEGGALEGPTVEC